MKLDINVWSDGSPIEGETICPTNTNLTARISFK